MGERVFQMIFKYIWIKTYNKVQAKWNAIILQVHNSLVQGRPIHNRIRRGRSRNLACQAGSSFSWMKPLFMYKFFAASLSTATWTYRSVMPEIIQQTASKYHISRLSFCIIFFGNWGKGEPSSLNKEIYAPIIELNAQVWLYEKNYPQKVLKHIAISMNAKCMKGKH